MPETPPANPAPNHQAEAVQPPCIDRLRTAADAAYAAQWHTITLNLKTVTPTLGGGVKPGQTDVLLPFRPRNVRNAIKHWWWLLNRHNPKYQVADGAKLLYKEMADIWGAAADGTGGGQSKVRVDVIHTQAKLANLNNNNLLLKTLRKVNGQGTGSWTHPEIYNNLTYALWIMQNEKDTILKEGYCWTLKIQYKNIGLKDSVKTSIYQAINAWLHLGGLGARTTRGLGKSELIEDCNDDRIKRFFNELDCGLESPPTWKLFNTMKIPMPGQQAVYFTNQLLALNYLIKKYSDYRQARQKKNNGARHSRSFWPKADVIRKSTCLYTTHHTPHQNIEVDSCMPLSELTFGAPLHYKFTSQGEKQSSKINFHLNDKTFERYTSPLHLTSVRIDNNQCAAFAFFHSNYWNDIKNNSVIIANSTPIPAGVWWPDFDHDDGALKTINVTKAVLWLNNHARQPATSLHSPDNRRQRIVDSATDSFGDPLLAFFNFAENGGYND